MLRRLLALLALTGLLSACGSPPAAPATQPTEVVSQATTAAPTSAVATIIATDQPTAETAQPHTATAIATISATEPPSPVVTTVATEPPSPVVTTVATEPPPAATAPGGTATAVAGVLPAPLLALQGGQVVRIDLDGTTRTTLTDEQPFTAQALAITDLAVSPASGSLAYVLQRENGNALIMTDADGTNRRVLVEDVPVATPRWSQDGSAIAVQMGGPGETDSPWKGGIWVFSAFSGEARQLIVNDTPPAGGTGEAWGYSPEAWAPDGSKLLVGRYSQVVETCDAAILDVATGALTVLEAPAGRTAPTTQCIGGSWAPDSSGVFVTLREPGLSPQQPGLYRADASSGAIEPVIPTHTADGRFAVVQSQVARPDGTLLALVAVVDSIPDPAAIPNAAAPPASLYRVAQDGALEQLRQESFALYGPAVWAPGGEGVVLPTQTDGGGVAYAYVPVSGAVVSLQIEPTSGIAWGR